MSNYINYNPFRLKKDEVVKRSKAFYDFMNKRRSVREFSDRPIPKEVIENIILTAASAPSGAHKQPWKFCAISDPLIKARIRQAAEEEEFTNYHGRMSEEWMKDLEVFETNWKKPFLEHAPWLIVVFKETYQLDGDEKYKNYYVNESVGIATGFLLAAIQNAGLAALTHTPSPMGFLQKILKRPPNEKPFLLIPVGFPSDHPKVPDLERKKLEDVACFYLPSE